jgi:PAS domain S-box-containing protein
MKMYKKLMLLVGLAMLLIMVITILSFQAITGGISDTLNEMRRLSAESEQIRVIERKIDELSHAVQSFVMTGDIAYLRTYEQARGDVNSALRNIANGRLGENERILLATLTSDLDGIKKKAEIIFALKSSSAQQKNLAENLLQELNRLHSWIGRDVEKYQNANNAEMLAIVKQISDKKVTGDVIVLFVLLASLGVLFGFVTYIHRTLSIPLNKLWEGTEEISRGNLDYRLQVHGSSDIALLSQRFNDMAQRLRLSYADLEQKLYDRTHELASLDAVALTLSQAGSLRDMLDKSLMKILESLSGIDPKGGIFLCDSDGETLRLTAHKGLSPEFVEREGIVKAGECLCGIVARTGDLLFTRHGCDDPRHTRAAGEGGHSHIIIPIKSRGIVLGVIFLYPQKDFELKPSDVQMLDAIGAQLGMAVENFRFYAEVKESSEKYWDLFENSNEILFTMDPGGRLTAVNKAAEIFSGYSKVELFGKQITDFLSREGVKTARRLFAGGFRGRQWTEIEVQKRDGSTAVVEVSAREMISNQQSTGYQVSARDVTEQKRIREMLLQAERLGAIGQIVVAVRHEINNPLTTVIGNTELLMERYDGKDKELMGRLETILNNALRIAEIVKQLQGIKKDKVVEYLQGVKMTDLKQK